MESDLHSRVSAGAAEFLTALITLGTEFERPTPDLSDDQDLDQVFGEARRHKLVATLAELAATGRWQPPGRWAEHLSRTHRDLQLSSIMAEATLLQCASTFAGRGIDFRALKGVAHAHLLYQDPSWRTSGDVDMLVPGAQIRAAVAALEADLGGSPRTPEPRSGFLAEFGKTTVVRVDRVEVDIHRTFVAGPFGLSVDLDALFGQYGLFDVGGVSVFALGPQHLFLHACFNVALGDQPVQLRSLRDLILAYERLPVDLAGALEEAAGWGGTAVVQRAGQLLSGVVGPDDNWTSELLRLRVPPRQRRLLSSYSGSGSAYRRQLASLAVIPGASAKARYLRALALPDRDFLDRRNATGVGYLLRAARRLRG